MARLSILGFRTLAAGVVAGIAVGSASAAPINIMALGDSITAGVGSNDSQFRETSPNSGVWSSRGGSGYRKSLNDYLANTGVLPEWNFVGPRSAPSTNPDDYPNIPPSSTFANNHHRHFGYPGDTADGLRSRLPGYSGDAPHTVLLHIGSNSSGDTMVSTPATYASTGNTAADAQLYRLLDTIRTDSDFSAVENILVARIIPKANEADLGRIINYNYSATQGIAGAVAALDNSFESKVQIVDLFKIEVTSAMLSFLAEQTGEFVNDLQSWIDPSNTGYVDWLDGLDEASHTITGTIARNERLYSDIVGYNGSSYIYGVDGTHPSDLGYAVMAWAWGQAIPEPTALALLGIGAAVMVARRRVIT